MVLKFEDDSLEEVRRLHCVALFFWSVCAAHMHALDTDISGVHAGLWTVPEQQRLPHRPAIQRSGEPGMWWPAPRPSLLIPKPTDAADVSRLLLTCAGLVVVSGNNLQPAEPN